MALSDCSANAEMTFSVRLDSSVLCDYLLKRLNDEMKGSSASFASNLVQDLPEWNGDFAIMDLSSSPVKFGSLSMKLATPSTKSNTCTDINQNGSSSRIKTSKNIVPKTKARRVHLSSKRLNNCDVLGKNLEPDGEFSVRNCTMENKNNVPVVESSKAFKEAASKYDKSSKISSSIRFETSGDVYKCSFCAYQTRKVASIRSHVRRNHFDRIIRCRFCKFTTKWKHNMKNHYVNKHDLERDEAKKLTNQKQRIFEKVKTSEVPLHPTFLEHPNIQDATRNGNSVVVLTEAQTASRSVELPIVNGYTVRPTEMQFDRLIKEDFQSINSDVLLEGSYDDKSSSKVRDDSKIAIKDEPETLFDQAADQINLSPEVSFLDNDMNHLGPIEFIHDCESDSLQTEGFPFLQQDTTDIFVTEEQQSQAAYQGNEFKYGSLLAGLEQRLNYLDNNSQGNPEDLTHEVELHQMELENAESQNTSSPPASPGIEAAHSTTSQEAAACLTVDFQCHICSYRTGKRVYLLNHLRRNHWAISATCTLCEYSTKWKQHLRTHYMNVHKLDLETAKELLLNANFSPYSKFQEMVEENDSFAYQNQFQS